MGTTTTGGSEDREEKRIPSYSKQFRQNFTITKKGKVKERSGISKAISGLPLKIRKFFPGNPLDPPLAGMIQIVLKLFFMDLSLYQAA